MSILKKLEKNDVVVSKHHYSESLYLLPVILSVVVR